MRTKVLLGLTCCFGVSLVGFLGLYGYIRIARPEMCSFEPSIRWSSLALTKDFRVSFGETHGEVDLLFFNQAAPYLGSIIGMGGDKTVSVSGCDGLGIYYRVIKHADRKDWDWWTLAVSLWYPIIMSGGLTAIFVWLASRSRHRSSR